MGLTRLENMQKADEFLEKAEFIISKNPTSYGYMELAAAHAQLAIAKNEVMTYDRKARRKGG